jgi:hypothetical protein
MARECLGRHVPCASLPLNEGIELETPRATSFLADCGVGLLYGRGRTRGNRTGRDIFLRSRDKKPLPASTFANSSSIRLTQAARLRLLRPQAESLRWAVTWYKCGLLSLVLMNSPNSTSQAVRKLAIEGESVMVKQFVNFGFHDNRRKTDTSSFLGAVASPAPWSDVPKGFGGESGVAP